MSEIIKLFPSLEEQINQPEIWRLGTSKTRVEVIDYKPEKPQSQTPVYLSMGWGGNPKAYEEVLKSLGARSRIISTTNLHGVDLDKKTNEDLPFAEMRKAIGVHELLKEKKLAEPDNEETGEISPENKIDAVGYSEGGMNILLAAIFNPDKFRNIVLVNPAGLLENDSEIELTGRFLKDFFLHFKDIRDNESNADKALAIKKWGSFYGGMVSSIAKGPIKALQEVTDMSHFGIRECLLFLRDKCGINISFVFNKADSAFPSDRFLGWLDDNEFDYEVLEGRHGDFVLNTSPVTRTVINQLDKMETEPKQV